MNNKKSKAIKDKALVHIAALEALLISYKHVDFDYMDNKETLLEFLNNILNGINPITGEILENGKGWNDPQVIDDIKSLTKDINAKNNEAIKNENIKNKRKIYKLNKQKYISQKEYREALLNSNNRYNSYQPWTEKEDKELIDLSKSLSVSELADHFKRIKGGIRSRLLKFSLNPQVREKKLIPNNSESNLKANFFKIEEYNNINFRLSKKYNKKYKSYDDLKIIFSDKDEILKRRNENKRKKRLLNSHFPVTEEEIKCLIRLNNEGKTLNQLEDYFQRSRRSLESMLKKEGLSPNL